RRTGARASRRVARRDAGPRVGDPGGRELVRPVVARRQLWPTALRVDGIDPPTSAAHRQRRARQRPRHVVDGARGHRRGAARIAPRPVAREIDQRYAIAVPMLIIGHENDLIPPFSDAENLAQQIPNARLVQAHSMFELRLKPERLTSEITRFLESVSAE